MKISVKFLCSAFFFIYAEAGFFPSMAASEGIPGVPEDNKLYKMGFLDVTLLGADSTGKTICTEAIQNAVNLARDNNLVCYFPSGTYLVDDTIKCMKKSRWDGSKWVEVNQYCVLVGSAKKRPLIKLVPGAAAFQNPLNPIPVFWFWSMCYFALPPPDYCVGSEDPNCNWAGINYNQTFRSIDIDLGGNPGATGIKHPAAQGSSIEDVKINATGAFAGLYNPTGGVAGGVFNVEVTGGKFAVYYKWQEQFSWGNVNQSNHPILSGCVFRDQETAVFHLDLAQPMVLVGFHIVKGPGAINDMMKGPGISLIDGIIEMGTGQMLAGTSNMYISNVYVKGATSIANNWTVSNPDAWTRVQEYSYCNSNYTNLIDGVFNKSEYRTKTENVNINPDMMAKELLLRHIWDSNGFPDFAQPDVVNVQDSARMNGLPAAGDGITDDTHALEYAIANYEKVFLPKGTYKITRNLVLGKNTQLFGTHRTYSRITGATVETTSDPEATTSLSFLKCGTLNWKAGRNSIVRSVSPGTININNDGGGKWYAIFNVSSQTFINGTRQSLSFYGFNPERAAIPQTEIKNAENVRLFFVKSEAGVGGQGHSGDHSTTIRIIDSRNIAVFGTTGNVTLSNGLGMIEVINSTDVIATHAKSTKTGTDWYQLKETYAGTDMGVLANTTLATYKRGSLPLGIADGFLSTEFTVYPNPFSTNFFINNVDGQSIPDQYEICDLRGNRISVGRITSNEICLEDNCPGGIYLLTLISDKNIYRKKIVKL
jgi:hypothetical protein